MKLKLKFQDVSAREKCIDKDIVSAFAQLFPLHSNFYRYRETASCLFLIWHYKCIQPQYLSDIRHALDKCLKLRHSSPRGNQYDVLPSRNTNTCITQAVSENNYSGFLWNACLLFFFSIRQNSSILFQDKCVLPLS